jgi:hypothetical protein
MKIVTMAMAAVMLVGVMAAPRPASAIGCLSGGAAGAVAGHVAGHHAVIGAVGGCVVGHHMKMKQKQQARAAAQAQQQQMDQHGSTAPTHERRRVMPGAAFVSVKIRRPVGGV